MAEAEAELPAAAAEEAAPEGDAPAHAPEDAAPAEAAAPEDVTPAEDAAPEDASPAEPEAPEDASPAEEEPPTDEASRSEEAPPADEAAPAEETAPPEEASPADEAAPAEEAAPADEAPPAEAASPAEQAPPVEAAPPTEAAPPVEAAPTGEAPPTPGPIPTLDLKPGPEAKVLSTLANGFYDREALKRQPTDSELDVDLCTLVHGFGMDTKKRNNIHYVGPGILLFAVGNITELLDLETMSQSYLPGLDGGGIGAVCVHPTRKYFVVAEKVGNVAEFAEFAVAEPAVAVAVAEVTVAEFAEFAENAVAEIFVVLADIAVAEIAVAVVLDVSLLLRRAPIQTSTFTNSPPSTSTASYAAGPSVATARPASTAKAPSSPPWACTPTSCSRCGTGSKKRSSSDAKRSRRTSSTCLSVSSSRGS